MTDAKLIIFIFGLIINAYYVIASSIIQPFEYTPEKVPVHCGQNVFDEDWIRLFTRIHRSPPYEVTKRIVGGTISKHGEWPWLTSLMFHQTAEQIRRQRESELERRAKNQTGEDEETFIDALFIPPTLIIPEPDGGRKFHLCGGTMIHPRWVLTATHCFINNSLYPDLAPIPERWTVRVGEHDMLDESIPHFDMEVERIVLHPKYSLDTHVNDIALVKLKRAVPLINHVNVACLPGEYEELEVGQMCYSIGWGHEKSAAKNISTVLRHVSLPIVSNEDCQASYNTLMDVEPELLIDVVDEMVCAGDSRGGRDSCQFDSGGPLMCRHGKQWRVEGVVSFGYKCGTHIPGVYTRVARLVPWIQDVVNNL